MYKTNSRTTQCLAAYSDNEIVSITAKTDSSFSLNTLKKTYHILKCNGAHFAASYVNTQLGIKYNTLFLIWAQFKQIALCASAASAGLRLA
jgi:hypothetical protein